MYRLNRKAHFGIVCAVAFPQSHGALWQCTQPAPLERRAQFKNLGNRSLCDQIAAGRHGTAILVLHLKPPFIDLADQH